jgi:hypothetical protein
LRQIRPNRLTPFALPSSESNGAYVNFRENQEDKSVNKTYRFLAITAISVALATSFVAWAQSYTTVDFPGATATLLTGGPDAQGTLIGQETTAGVNHGFTLTAQGVFAAFDPPGSIFTIPNFITPDGTIVGQYEDGSNVEHGFILHRGRYTIFDVPGAPASALSSLNPEGEMTGFTCLVDRTCENPPYESFVVSRQGEITSFNPFGAPSSFASVVNLSGELIGTYTDSSGATHGYILRHQTFARNDFPGAILTFNGGLNPQGDIVGLYTDTSNVTHSFLLSDGRYTGFDPPGAVYSDAAAINACGIIVGFYVDSAGVAHGYIRTPRR